MTSGWSMKAITRIAPHTAGTAGDPASETCVLHWAHRCVRAREQGGWLDFDESLRSRSLPLFLCRLPLPSTDGAVPAIVPDQVLALVGEVRGEGGQPVQGGEDLEVSRETGCLVEREMTV